MRRPDGDVELQQTDFSSFAVPPCQRTPPKAQRNPGVWLVLTGPPAGRSAPVGGGQIVVAS